MYNSFQRAGLKNYIIQCVPLQPLAHSVVSFSMILCREGKKKGFAGSSSIFILAKITCPIEFIYVFKPDH